PSVENWKNTPDITGLRSSFPVAKIVLLIAVAKTSAGIVFFEASSRVVALGNSFPLAYAKAYFPELELISIVLLSSTVKVRGCSAKVLSVSSSNLAGTATLPWLSESISITADIVVSKSETVTVSSLLSSSNKKLSRIGRVLLLLITPLNTCNCFSKSELDTINFICFSVISFRAQIYRKMTSKRNFFKKRKKCESG